jgi:hypothetical protein
VAEVVLQSQNSAGDWFDLASDDYTNRQAPFEYTPSGIPSSLPDGEWKIRAMVRDGQQRPFIHENPSGFFRACIDRAITPADTAERPSTVEYLRLYKIIDGVQVNTEAKIRFTVPGNVARAQRWIVERKVGEEWAVVGIEPHVAGTTAYQVVDRWATDADTKWRVSAATQPCTRTGDATIATESADAPGTPEPAEPHHRMAPLLGLERFWSYWSMPTGGGNDLHVNVATGNLVTTRTLLSEARIGRLRPDRRERRPPASSATRRSTSASARFRFATPMARFTCSPPRCPSTTPTGTERSAPGLARE